MLCKDSALHEAPYGVMTMLLRGAVCPMVANTTWKQCTTTLIQKSVPAV